MRRRTEFAELQGKAFWFGDMLVTRAEVRGVTRQGVLVRWRGGRCGDRDTNQDPQGIGR